MRLTVNTALLAGALIMPLGITHANGYIGLDSASIGVENQLNDELNLVA